MSIISELGKGYCNLPAILEKYQNEINNAKEHLSLKGKPIGDCNKEQCSWELFYHERCVELKTLTKYFESMVNRERGILYRNFTENFSIELTDRAKDQYINSEPDYLSIQQLYLEVKEMYDKYQSIVDCFKSRGYSLNNLTKLVLEQVTEHTL